MTSYGIDVILSYTALEDGRRPDMTRTASRKTKILYLHLSFFVDDHQFTVFDKERKFKSNQTMCACRGIEK